MELLIALTLMAVMVGIIAGGFNISIRIWESGEERLENHYGVTEAIQLLVQQIKPAKKAYIIDDLMEERRIAFKGNATSITFVTATPRFHSHMDTAGLFLQEITYKPGKKILEFREGYFDPHKRVDAPFDGVKVELGDGKITSFRFEYYIENSLIHESESDDDRFMWVGAVNYLGEETGGEWAEGEEKETFPKAVKVRMKVANDRDEFVWPDLLIPLYQDMEIKKPKTLEK